jgi:phosphoglycerate dehydrogenase-like enzyme
MELLISDPFVTPDEILNLGGKAVSLETLLKKSDFVSIHVPLMPSTRHLIGEKEIKMMKSTAFLINTARGAVIDESALIKCLNENIILGAALDVFEVEPLPVDSPLRSLENVVMVSHQGTAPEAGKRMVYVAVENVTRFLQGERPLYIQNPKVIYMNEERRET